MCVLSALQRRSQVNSHAHKQGRQEILPALQDQSVDCSRVRAGYKVHAHGSGRDGAALRRGLQVRWYVPDTPFIAYVLRCGPRDCRGERDARMGLREPSRPRQRGEAIVV